jgi:hypothetical protein
VLDDEKDVGMVAESDQGDTKSEAVELTGAVCLVVEEEKDEAVIKGRGTFCIIVGEEEEVEEDDDDDDKVGTLFNVPDCCRFEPLLVGFFTAVFKPVILEDIVN